MALNLGEYQEVFLEEAEEQIDSLNASLLALEKNYDNLSYINEIFRAAHSLKSSAAFVGLTQLSELAHHMESLLQQVRDGQRKINATIINVLFRCFDIIRSIVDHVSKGESPEMDMRPIIAEVQRLVDQKDVSQEISKPANGKEVGQNGRVISKSNDGAKKTLLSEDEKRIIIEGLKDGLRCFDLSIQFEEGVPALWMRLHLVLQQLENQGSIIKSMPDRKNINSQHNGRLVRVILLTSEDEQAVHSAADVDQVEKIEIKALRLKGESNYKTQEKKVESKPQVMSEDDIYANMSAVDSADFFEEEKKPGSAQEKREESTHQPFAVVNNDELNRADQTVSDSMKDITSSISQTVKVPVKKLDDLLNNVAELVIANSGFIKIYDEIRNKYGNSNITTEFKNRIEQMNRIAKDLQGGIMNTRMIPIGTVFKRFNRLVRDLSKEFNKEINLILRGEDTELDKKVIDSLGEPLLHLIRNSVDHGLESVQERTDAGKDPVGTILLNAYQGGNRILVEVVDDGRGLNKDRIKRKAIDRNLANLTQIETMTDDDLYQMIFLPGFSTAERVTDISGRGVGMNVVKEVVTMLNGSVSVETEIGIGTKFTMTFPLTTAIIAAIMIRAEQDLYAVPLSDVIETIKVSEDEISTIENHEVIYLREDILSLVRLNKALGLSKDDRVKDTKKKLPVVVVGYGNRKVGLVVDKLEGKQEIVIKSLEQNFRSIEGLSGASILGDGSIALILDVQAMINLAITNTVRLEEKRFKQKIKKQSNGQGGDLSAAEFFKDFGQQTEKETLPPVRQVEKKTELIGKPIESSSGMELSPEDAIRQIRAEANANILKAAESAGVHDMLLRPEELDELNRISEEAAKKAGFSDKDMEQILDLANIGVKHAANSLSQIVNKKVDMSIPDINMLPVEILGQEQSQTVEEAVTVILRMEADVEGHILLSLEEKDAYHLVDILYGTEAGKTKNLDDDAESALKEITNIVGTGLLNSLGDSLSLKIVPSVPELYHDFFSSTVESIVIEHAKENEYALMLNTEFFISDVAVMGKIYILPKHSSIHKFLMR